MKTHFSAQRSQSTHTAQHIATRHSAAVSRRIARVATRVVTTTTQHGGAAVSDRAHEGGRAQPVLCTKFKAHEAAITALSVLRDEPGFKQIVTASLDKSLAVWTLQGGEPSGPQLQQSRRMEVPGGPVFSLQRGIKTKITDPSAKPRDPLLFCGLAAKEVVALHTDTLAFSQQARMNGHTGWVRSMTSSGKYLFTCGCNNLYQWDQAYAVPKEVRSKSLFTGDILALAATEREVLTAGADGALRRWALGSKGELTAAEAREKAHDGRITALAVYGRLLFSAGYDGDIKAWDVSNLQLVMEVKGAHAGERVRSLTIGPTATSSKGSSPGSSPAPSPAPSPPPAAAAEAGEVCCEVSQPQQEPGQEQQQQPVVDAYACLDLPQAAPAADVTAPTTEGPPAAAAEAEVTAEAETTPAETGTSAAAQTEALPTEVAAEAAEALPAPAAEAEAPAAEAEAPAAEAEALSVPAAEAESEAAAQATAVPAAEAEVAAAPEAAAPVQPAPSRSSSSSSSPAAPSSSAVLYSGGDDGLVRCWDVVLLSPAGPPLSLIGGGGIKALAVGERQALVSGDANGEVAVWLV